MCFSMHHCDHVNLRYLLTSALESVYGGGIHELEVVHRDISQATLMRHNDRRRLAVARKRGLFSPGPGVDRV